MPVKMKGQTYYRTSDACRIAGISRSTLLRWLKSGVINVSHRDRRGWRLFTEADLEMIKEEVNDIK